MNIPTSIDFPNTFAGGTDDTCVLRELTKRFCAEEYARLASVPDPRAAAAAGPSAAALPGERHLPGTTPYPAVGDELNLTALEEEFRRIIGAPSNGALPETHLQGQGPTVPAGLESGFGIGIPEIQSLQQLAYEETDTLNTDELRKDFPVLQQRVNGKPIVWFDNGATTQKPRQVIEALTDYYTHYNSNIHRGAHTLAARATDAYEGAREKVRAFINAASTDEIVFVRGTTEGINLVAQTFGRHFVGPGDEVIVSTLDHHANIVPWQQVCKERGAKLVAIPVNQDGDLILQDYERLITPRTRFVSVGHVNNTYGTINDIRSIIEAAHRHNIPVLIDGAQSIAHTKVDVQALDADFYVFSGHKIYGPTGIGVVYGKKRLLDILPPWQGGGNMIKDVTIEETQFNEPPARFEAGTPNVADAIGLGAALDYVQRVGLANIERHEHDLTEYARTQLAAVPGLTLLANPKHRVSVVSFVIDNVSTPQVGQLLDKEGIAVRAGHHCAQPALRALGYEMSVRPTFAFYNTREEVDRLVIAVRKIAHT